MKIYTKLALIVFFLLLIACGLQSNSFAAVPHLINYQGRLTDTNGAPLTDGAHNITFRIYDALNGGTLLWEGTYSVNTQKGIFNVLLGDISNSGYDFSTLAFDKPYFLEIKVGEEVMGPRQQITSSGYAIKAEKAEKAEDANTISNIGVSSTPAPNKLLPLDSSAKLPASQGLLGNNIAILTGTIANGGTIPLPAGYTQEQCRWIACLGRIAWGDDQHATEFDIGASADANRVVSIVDYRHGWQRPQSYANYIIIGIK